MVTDFVGPENHVYRKGFKIIIFCVINALAPKCEFVIEICSYDDSLVPHPLIQMDYVIEPFIRFKGL